MSRQGGVLVINGKSGHLGACGAGCGCGGTKTHERPAQLSPAQMDRLSGMIEDLKCTADLLPGPAQQQQYAVPTPADAALADTDPDNKSPNGNPHGDDKILRRRRATELERLIRENRKLARAKAPNSAARARWDAEYQQLSTELAAIREAERDERERYKQF